MYICNLFTIFFFFSILFLIFHTLLDNVVQLLFFFRWYILRMKINFNVGEGRREGKRKEGGRGGKKEGAGGKVGNGAHPNWAMFVAIYES